MPRNSKGKKTMKQSYYWKCKKCGMAGLSQKGASYNEACECPNCGYMRIRRQCKNGKQEMANPINKNKVGGPDDYFKHSS